MTSGLREYLPDLAVHAPPHSCVTGTCDGEYSCAPFNKAIPWLRECLRCGVQFADPQPSDAALDRCYGPQYYQTFGASVAADGTSYLRAKRRTAVRVLRCLPRAGAGCRLLEVGCGLGEFLVEARCRGWEAEGVERNPVALDAMPAELRQHVTAASFEDFEPGERYDAIVLLDVLEHLRDPIAQLRRAAAMLRPQGRILITTPDRQALAARLLQSRWFHYHPDHLWYFERRSLRRTLAAAGIEIVILRTALKHYTVDYVVNCLRMAAVPSPVSALAARFQQGMPRFVRDWPLPPLAGGLICVGRRAD